MAVTLHKRILKSGNIQFYLSVYIDGQQTLETLFTTKPNDLKEKKKLAEAIRAERELEVLAKGTKYVPRHKKKIALLDYFDYYIENYDKKDIRMMEGVVSKFRLFLPDKKILITDLTESHFLKFIDYLNNKCGFNGETPHSYWKRFKKIILQANRDGYIDDIAYKNVRFKKKGDYSETKLTKQVLTEEEITVLQETYCGNAEIKKAFMFACYSGLGLAECKVLKWNNIINDRIIINREKTGTEINLALSQAALGFIGKRQEPQGLVFDLKHEGKFISEVSINKTLNNWLKKAEIDKKISFYCGRHTFATRLLIKGANLKTVSDALAHKTTANTIKYLNYVNSLKDEATSNL